MIWLPDNWSDLFLIKTPILELVIRGTALYFAILVLMRLLPRRTGGEVSTTDFIFILLVAEGASNAFGDYKSITEGIILVGVLVSCNFSMNVISYKFRFIERLVSARPIQVVRNGELLRRNMRQEFLTQEELMSALRQYEIATLDEVEAAFIEGEGVITVVKRKKQSD